MFCFAVLFTVNNLDAAKDEIGEAGTMQRSIGPFILCLKNNFKGDCYVPQLGSTG